MTSSKLEAIIKKRVPEGISKFSSFSEILESRDKVGIWENIFFRNKPDHSRVFIFFSGAVDYSMMHLVPVFHRWKWTEYLNHPSFIIHDPSVNIDSGLKLGWYAGSKSGKTFHAIMEIVLIMAKDLAPGAKIVFLGSSGGGFAALMGVAHNLCDYAFAFNPQTAVIKYEQPKTVEKYLSFYGASSEMLDQSDEERLSVIAALGNFRGRSGLCYRQNIEDKSHYKDHFMPFARRIGEIPFDLRKNIVFEVYSDKKAKHMASSLEETLVCIDQRLPGAIGNNGLEKIK